MATRGVPRSRTDGTVGVRIEIDLKTDEKIAQIIKRTRQSKKGFILWLIDNYIESVDDEGHKLEERKALSADGLTKTPRLEKAV